MSKNSPKLIKAYIQQKRKSYQTGGFQNMDPNTLNQGITGAASIGTSLIDTLEPANDFGATSDGAAVGKGALKGAAAGAAAGSVIGPWGTVVGGAIGGIAGVIRGLVGNNKAQEAQAKAKSRKRQLDAAKNIQESNAILASYDNQGTGITSFKKGGILYSYPAVWTENPLKFKKSKYTFQKGGKLELENAVPAVNGDLEPISDTSFEVVGDNPQATDDVMVNDAFLDHGEIVQPTGDGMKIYSDTLKVPGSKLTFAKASKKLEKQKTTDEARFPAQNKLIAAKQDKLFALQQQLNNNNTGESVEEAMLPAGRTKGAGFSEGNMFQGGGLSYPGISGSGITDTEEFFNLQNMYKKKPKAYQTGGELTWEDNPNVEYNFKDKSLNKDIAAKKAGSQYLITREDVNNLTNLDNNHPLISMLPGYRKQVLSEFEKNPNLSQIQASDLNLAMMPKMKVNGQEYGQMGNANVFNILSRGYSKPAPVQDSIPVNTPAPIAAPVQEPLPVTVPQVTTPKPITNIQPVKAKATRFKQTDPYKMYSNSHKRKMGYQQGGEVVYDTDNWEFGSEAKKKNPYKVTDALGHLGTIAPVFANMAAANNLPAVPVPTLNKSIQLQKANYGDQEVALKQGLRTAMEASRLNSVNPNAQAAGVSNSLAKYLSATNQMHGDINRQNSQINNQQALINSNILAGNTHKLDNYNAGQTARASNILNLQSQNRADLSNKMMGLLAQQNQKTLDQQKNDMFLEYINKIAPGLSDRNQYLDATAEGFKKGGKLKIGYKRGGMKKYC